jgi:hypothetical protein
MTTTVQIQKTLQIRCQTLKRISWVPVTGRVEKGVAVYTFGQPQCALKEVWTYGKAKVFAEGIAIGRSL